MNNESTQPRKTIRTGPGFRRFVQGVLGEIGITQKALSGRLGISEALLSARLGGHKNWDLAALAQLGGALGMPEARLISEAVLDGKILPADDSQLPPVPDTFNMIPVIWAVAATGTQVMHPDTWDWLVRIHARVRGSLDPRIVENLIRTYRRDEE